LKPFLLDIELKIFIFWYFKEFIPLLDLSIASVKKSVEATQLLKE
jgi:hypothetical protein